MRQGDGKEGFCICTPREKGGFLKILKKKNCMRPPLLPACILVILLKALCPFALIPPTLHAAGGGGDGFCICTPRKKGGFLKISRKKILYVSPSPPCMHFDNSFEGSVSIRTHSTYPPCGRGMGGRAFVFVPQEKKKGF